MSRVVPFTQPLNGPVQKGSEIRINGTVCFDYSKTVRNFIIELLSYPIIVLHMSFRFTKAEIVFVSFCFDDGWSKDQRVANPLKNGDQFDLRILVHDTHYEISLNGKFLTAYEHRYPYQNVSAIGVQHQVTIEKIRFNGHVIGT